MIARNLPIHSLVPCLLAALALDSAPAMAQQSLAQRERDLDRKLAASEAKAKALESRIEKLQRQLDELATAQSRSAASAVSASPSPQVPEPAPHVVRTAAPPPVAQAARPPSTRAGSFDVDEDAAQRALERTLTQSGALLLPRGSISLTPGLAYARVERTSSVLADIVNPATGTRGVALGNSTLRRNEFTARMDLRAGLPLESQLEVSLPFQYVRSSQRDAFGGEARDNGSDIGDLTIGLAKTLMREKGMAPDLIGRLTYNTGTGRQTDGQVALGSGFRQITGELVALKRQDPLAFFAAASYGHAFEEGGIKPGALTNISLGTVLAASPATSLQFGFTQAYRQKQEVNGLKVPASDETFGLISIGASSILSRNVMLIVSAGVGVGEDAPKYTFNVSVPITFK